MTEDLSLPIEGDLETAESNLDLRSRKTSGAVIALSYVPDKTSSVVTMRAKISGASDESPRTQYDQAYGSPCFFQLG